MKLLSLNGESVEINTKDSQVLIFDTLYIEDLKAHSKLFEVLNKSIKEIEDEIFKWSDGSLLGLYSLKFDCSLVNIHVEDIKYYSPGYVTKPDKIFSSDSGLIAIVSCGAILPFLDYIVYDDLVDLLNIDRNQVLSYLTELSLNIGNTFAIISTPGIGKGFDFEGSGQYIIDNECFK